jgi:hypothetical protein
MIISALCLLLTFNIADIMGKIQPSLAPGVGFHLQFDGTWKPEKIPSKVLKNSAFSGYLKIKGKDCSVFETPSKDQWAQVTPPAGLNMNASVRFCVVAATLAEETVGSIKWISAPVDPGVLKKFADEENIKIENLQENVKKSKLQKLSLSDWKNLEESLSYNLNAVQEMVQSARNDDVHSDILESMEDMSKYGYAKAPVIAQREDGSVTLISGDEQLIAARALGVTPEVMLVHLD